MAKYTHTPAAIVGRGVCFGGDDGWIRKMDGWLCWNCVRGIGSFCIVLAYLSIIHVKSSYLVRIERNRISLLSSQEFYIHHVIKRQL